MTLAHERNARPVRKLKRAGPGSRRKRSRRLVVGLAEMIDAALGKMTTIRVGGERRRITVFQAILLVLWIAEMQGDARAAKVRLRFEAFAREQQIVLAPEIVVIGGLPRHPPGE